MNQISDKAGEQLQRVHNLAIRSGAPASERTARQAPPADGAKEEAKPQDQRVPRQKHGNGAKPEDDADDQATSNRPRTIEVVSTWQDLLDQPPIKLAEGTARLGIDTTKASVGEGVLLYCLTAGYPTPIRWRSDDRLGPFHVTVRRGDKHLMAAEAVEEAR